MASLSEWLWLESIDLAGTEVYAQMALLGTWAPWERFLFTLFFPVAKTSSVNQNVPQWRLHEDEGGWGRVLVHPTAVVLFHFLGETEWVRRIRLFQIKKEERLLLRCKRIELSQCKAFWLIGFLLLIINQGNHCRAVQLADSLSRMSCTSLCQYAWNISRHA